MREKRFIEKNAHYWKEFESELRKKKSEPKNLSRLFIQITEDLSYAQTFYRHRSVRHYLNNLAQWLYLDIYKNKRYEARTLFNFWTEELPSIMYHARKQLLWSFLFFVLSVSIGILSSHEDGEFVRQILGDHYVDMTIANIEKGDPMAVYKQANEMDMFMGITLNNLLVAVRTFILGFFAGIGTLASLLSNGIMLGSFQYFFIERGLFVESFLTIWQHGTLEISAIIISGAAGLVLARGLILPGSYTRAQALMMSARRGVKIMIGITPIFVIAAFIEGYITRYTEMPDPVKILVILLSLAFITGYYVAYPFRLPMSVKLKYQQEEMEQHTPKFEYDPTIIREAPQHFADSFRLFKARIESKLSRFVYLALAYSLFISIGAKVLGGDAYNLTQIRFDSIGTLVSYNDWPLMNVVNVIFMSLLFGLIFNEEIQGKSRPWPIIKVWIMVSLYHLIFWLPDDVVVLFALLNLPVLVISVHSIITLKKGVLSSIGYALNLISFSIGKFFIVTLTSYLLGFMLFWLMTSPVLLFHLNIVNWNLPFSLETNNFITSSIGTGVLVLALIVSLYYLAISLSIFIHSAMEWRYAEGLKKRIDNMSIFSK